VDPPDPEHWVLHISDIKILVRTVQEQIICQYVSLLVHWGDVWMGRHNCARKQVLGAGAAWEEGSFARSDNKNKQE
jgi:hypothetical protein